MYHQKPMLGEKPIFEYPIAHNFEGCWLMNEGSGNPRDLILKRGPDVVNGSPAWVPNALSFDGADDYISIKIADGYTSVKAISIRMNIDSGEGGWVYLLDGRNNGLANSYVSLNGIGAGISAMWVDGVSKSVSSANLVKGRWVDYVFEFSSILPSTTNLRIACDHVMGNQLKTEIEHIYLLSSTPTTSEAMAFHIDPYYMFKPYFDPVLMAHVAVGGLSIPVAMHHYLHNLGK